jgi:hypothetical protein
MIGERSKTREPLLEIAVMVRNQANVPITVDATQICLRLRDGRVLHPYPGYIDILGFRSDYPKLIEVDGEDVTLKRARATSTVVDSGHMAVLGVTYAWDQMMTINAALDLVDQVELRVTGEDSFDISLRPADEWRASPLGPTREQISVGAERAREALRKSAELDKRMSELRGAKKSSLREAVGYSVLYGEQAQKILAELRTQTTGTPAEVAAEAALSVQVERFAAVRAAFEFEERYGKGPAAAKWSEVKEADQKYKRSLQDAYRSCSEAVIPRPSSIAP